MINENDSYEDVLPENSSLTQILKHGLKIGAMYVLICADSDKSIPREPVFVMPGECVGSIEKACWRSSFHVEHFDLDEIRRKEAEA